MHHRFNWKRVSAASAICYRWDGRRARLYFQTQPGAYNDATLVEFLKELRRHFRGDKVVLLWDGLPSHRSRAMQAHVLEQRSWLTVERLPAYAPDLNPVEGLWGNLKGRHLANRGDDTIEATVAAASAGVQRVSRDQRLLFGFLAQTGLRI